MKTEKIIIAVDFDGVLSDFSSGWKGARDTSDPPVEGAIKWLSDLLDSPHLFKVTIYSARNFRWGGRRAIKRWLLLHGLTDRQVKRLKFPIFKPACTFLLDDRCLRFTGQFPTRDQMLLFTPWHGKGVW